MNDETRAENMLLNKECTRKRLIAALIEEQKERRDALRMMDAAAAKLSEANDHNPYGPDTVKKYTFDEAIERACALLAERISLIAEAGHLEVVCNTLNENADRRDAEIKRLTAERDTAQEAAATVGAAFNDFRKQASRFESGYHPAPEGWKPSNSQPIDASYTLDGVEFGRARF